MNHEVAINLIKSEIKDLGYNVENCIDKAYSVSSRGAAPTGASWNKSEAEQIRALDSAKDSYRDQIEQLEETLETLEETIT